MIYLLVAILETGQVRTHESHDDQMLFLFAETILQWQPDAEVSVWRQVC